MATDTEQPFQPSQERYCFGCSRMAPVTVEDGELVFLRHRYRNGYQCPASWSEADPLGLESKEATSG